VQRGSAKPIVQGEGSRDAGKESETSVHTPRRLKRRHAKNACAVTREILRSGGRKKKHSRKETFYKTRSRRGRRASQEVGGGYSTADGKDNRTLLEGRPPTLAGMSCERRDW
jgi:hypothetical protein